MEREKLFISTTAADADRVARKYGLGLEIAEFCTAWNLDQHFLETDKLLQSKLDGIQRCLLHGPFNELFPCAIDPKARTLAAERFRQTLHIAAAYRVEKVIFHGGFQPRMYYPQWYVEQSILFWKDFLQVDPDVEIVLENVLEETPELLADIVKGVDHPRLRMCLDVGHVNVYSKISPVNWIEEWAPYLSHFHLHNNDGTWDTHSPLDRGQIPMRELLAKIDQRCPDATVTLELMEAEPSVRWLLEE